MMDLHPGNIIIDRKGIHWIIDWEEAGAYPVWFDYVRAAY
jgi:thiamine kinase-like enzyme